jgi:D-alanyl-D-alanine carboxypeptidase (penicillin-binding protein 5/6)
MIISSNKDNIRLIGIVGGLPSRDNRTIEMRKLINYGQRNFRKYNLFNKNEVLDEVDIWEGKRSKLNILTSENISLLLNIRTRRNLNAKYSFNQPIIAPIKKGQIIGKLTVYNDEKEIINSSLISGENIERNNIFGRILQKIRYLIN